MAIIRAQKRRKKGNKRLDLVDLREVLADPRTHTGIGVVIDPDEDGNHFELVMDGATVIDVLVEVELMPTRQALTCRLGAGAGGGGGGLWRVPAVGDEVGIILPEGRVDFQPYIAVVLGSRNVPARVSDARTILVATDEIEVQAPTVKLGSDVSGLVAADGAVQGTGIDAFTGATYFALGNASGKVLIEK